jgi:hypothetical protein
MDSDRPYEKNRRANRFFIQQSIRSDYCGVYATAMLLSLLGEPISRRRAHKIFGVVPANWMGTSCRGITTAIRRVMPAATSTWRHGRPQGGKSFQGFCAKGGSMPALVSAWCFHRRYRVICGHAFVITGMSEHAVRIVDPLCPPPTTDWNAAIDTADTELPYLNVQGSAWMVDLRHSISILTVSP